MDMELTRVAACQVGMEFPSALRSFIVHKDRLCALATLDGYN